MWDELAARVAALHVLGEKLNFGLQPCWSIASLIKSHYSSPGFSIIALISLLCLLLYHRTRCYSDYLYCSVFNNEQQCLEFCSVEQLK